MLDSILDSNGISISKDKFWQEKNHKSVHLYYKTDTCKLKLTSVFFSAQ